LTSTPFWENKYIFLSDRFRHMAEVKLFCAAILVI